MTYRTIQIADASYQYVAGKTHVHIKGGHLTKPLNFRKVDVGLKVEWTCDCCGEPLSRIGYRAEETGYNYVITPAVVKNVILAHIG